MQRGEIKAFHAEYLNTLVIPRNELVRKSCNKNVQLRANTFCSYDISYQI